MFQWGHKVDDSELELILWNITSFEIPAWTKISSKLDRLTVSDGFYETALVSHQGWSISLLVPPRRAHASTSAGCWRPFHRRRGLQKRSPPNAIASQGCSMIRKSSLIQMSLHVMPPKGSIPVLLQSTNHSFTFQWWCNTSPSPHRFL
jgi:hypothetical protein